MDDHKTSCKEAEQEYKQQKEQINTAAEEVDSKKVGTFHQPQVG